MNLQTDLCYEAVRARDRKYDGVFFTGVKTTGIFCRPICPAVTPLRKNCTFFPSAAAALQAGFRPCLRCRPESSPHSPAWNGVLATVNRALALIEKGELNSGSVVALCERLGITDRYLRKLFAEHVGASPKAVARAHRLLRAKRLITDTRQSMSQIAGLAGFSSIRQFNSAIRQCYGCAPSALRQSKLRSGTGNENTVHR